MRLLHHEPIAAPGQEPAHWFLVLHGLLGSGRNWASVSRRIVQESPRWGALLVDLREHGGSTGFEPPHTLSRAAEDVRVLIDALRLEVPLGMGHSFGGKVVMQVAQDQPGLMKQLVVVDSTPAKSHVPGDASRILRLLRELPDRFDTRGHAVERMLRAGESQMMAQWLAMSLVERDGGWAWGIDVEAIEAMLADFQRQEYWSLLERAEVAVDFLRGSRSDVMTPDVARRLESLGPRVRLRLIEGGHWLHIDNPHAVVKAVAEHLHGFEV